jgi:hypothetical protein
MNELFQEVLTEIYEEQPKLFGYDVAASSEPDWQMQCFPLFPVEAQSLGLSQ